MCEYKEKDKIKRRKVQQLKGRSYNERRKE
jgi:hypothetical protein